MSSHESDCVGSSIAPLGIPRQMAWCAWFVVSLFYAYQYILRVIPNIILPNILEQFQIDTAVFGQFSGGYYIGYCLMHLPVGILLDRYGPKKVMPACILLTVVGSLPIIFADHWIYPIFGRFLTGIGSSAAILGAFKIIRMTFAEKHFTRLLSFCVTIGLLGAIYGGEPVSHLCEIYGHKAVMAFLSVVGVFFAAGTYFLVPALPQTHKTSIKNDLKTVFTNKKVLCICFLAGLMVGPMEGFADAWGSEFLKKVYGLTTTQANTLTSLIYIGMFFAPVLSHIGEKTQRYMGTTAGAGFMMALVFILLMIKILNPTSIGIGLFVVGICSAYQILAIYKASTYVPEAVVGLTTAAANMIIMSFGYVFHSTIGIIIKFFGTQGQSLAFIYGVSIIPMTLTLGSLGFMILSYQEHTPSTEKP